MTAARLPRETSEVPPRSARDEHPSGRVEPDLFTKDVGRYRHRRHHEDDEVGHALEHFEQRQREDVEADVAAENRVRLTERRLVQKIEPRFPAAAGVDRREQRDQPDDADRERADAAWVHHDRLRPLRRGDHERPRTQRPKRQQQVAEQQPEDDETRDDGDERLGRQGPDEHAFVPQLLEPEPIGVELGRRRDAGDEEHQHQQQG
jgi:hypothetical protein